MAPLLFFTLNGFALPQLPQRADHGVEPLINLRARAADVEADIACAFRAVGVAAHDGNPVFLHQQGLQRIHPFGGVDAKAAQVNPGEIGSLGHPIVDGGESRVEPRRHMGEVAVQIAFQGIEPGSAVPICADMGQHPENGRR